MLYNDRGLSGNYITGKSFCFFILPNIYFFVHVLEGIDNYAKYNLLQSVQLELSVGREGKQYRKRTY